MSRAHDGHHVPPSPPNAPASGSGGERPEAELLAPLIELVIRRAQAIDSARDPATALEPLRQAVDALDHVLDAIQLLRAEGLVPEEGAAPSVGCAPERRGRAPHGSEPPGAAPEMAEPPLPGSETRAHSPPPGAAPLEPRAPRPELRAPEGPPEGSPAAVDGAGGSARPSTPVRFPAFRDPETGLLTREGLEAIAAGDLKRCMRHGRPFSLLLLLPDVDETAGIARGAEAVRSILRGSDLIARDLGGAIAVVLEETGLPHARRVAERLVDRLAEHALWGPAGRIGISGYPIHGETLWTLLETARGQLAQPTAAVLGERGANQDSA